MRSLLLALTAVLVAAAPAAAVPAMDRSFSGDGHRKVAALVDVRDVVPLAGGALAVASWDDVVRLDARGRTDRRTRSPALGQGLTTGAIARGRHGLLLARATGMSTTLIALDRRGRRDRRFGARGRVEVPVSDARLVRGPSGSAWVAGAGEALALRVSRRGRTVAHAEATPDVTFVDAAPLGGGLLVLVAVGDELQLQRIDRGGRVTPLGPVGIAGRAGRIAVGPSRIFVAGGRRLVALTRGGRAAAQRRLAYELSGGFDLLAHRGGVSILDTTGGLRLRSYTARLRGRPSLSRALPDVGLHLNAVLRRDRAGRLIAAASREEEGGDVYDREDFSEAPPAADVFRLRAR